MPRNIASQTEQNGAEALAQDVRFKTSFNEQVAELQGIAERLSGLVEDFTQVRSFDAPEAPGSVEGRERPPDEIRFGSSSRSTSACRMGSTRISAANARRCSPSTACASTTATAGRSFTAP
ncbi:hypothetical protein [uncultured Thiohalocapsa sp.]|uniref:hypothetical protein n=1 Tax=uncultured Thiohalocapsa sp. TaxID=768990 RepID=UPI0025E4D57E|nr:hypothetical protein [uncultured Thiohalocapsa sp.]